jgi:hypothetical protein
MTRPTLFPRSVVLGALVALAGCNRTTPEATPATDAPRDAAPPPVGSGNPLADLKSRLSQKQTPPPVDPREIVPVAKRDPDWDLETQDPARDYVRRYVWGVSRYGDLSTCVDAQASIPESGKATVRVVDAYPQRCASPTGIDEIFGVDVGADHLELVHQQSDRPKLGKWADGSDPLGPAKTPVPEFANSAKWTTPTGDVFKDARLAVVRIQLYGRGTYPFVMLAGWPDWFPRSSDQAMRDAFAVKVCTASKGLPLAVAAGLNRSDVLRIRCGASPTGVWETL